MILEKAPYDILKLVYEYHSTSLAFAAHRSKMDHVHHDINRMVRNQSCVHNGDECYTVVSWMLFGNIDGLFTFYPIVYSPAIGCYVVYGERGEQLFFSPDI